MYLRLLQDLNCCKEMRENNTTRSSWQAEEGCWRALEPPQLLPNFLDGLRGQLAAILAQPATSDNPSPIPLALSSLLFALGNPELGISVPAAHAEQAALTASPILPSGSQSAGGSGELIGAVHSEAGLDTAWRVLHSEADTAADAHCSEACQTQHSQECNVNQDIPARLDGTSISADGSRSIERQGDESSLCNTEVKTGLLDGAPEQAAESGAESPTRPQAAERMDEAIQQGLELWTPTKSDEAPELPEAAGSMQDLSACAASPGGVLPSESLHADSPEARQANGTRHTTACEDAPAAAGEEHQGRQSTDGEGADALGSIQQDEVDRAGHDEHECGQVSDMNGSECGPSGELASSSQKEQHNYRRKWNLKLPGKAAHASKSEPMGAKELSATAQSGLAAPASGNATPRKSGFFGGRLARFGRSRGGSEAASVSEEASSLNGLAMPAPLPSQQLKGKEPAIDEQPDALLYGSQHAAVEQSFASVSVRRSQSERAAESRPGKRAFLKKQLTRFGRARGVSDSASAAGDDADAISVAGSQTGTRRFPAARILRWGDLGKSQAPKWPVEDLGALDGQEVIAHCLIQKIFLLPCFVHLIKLAKTHVLPFTEAGGFGDTFYKTGQMIQYRVLCIESSVP